MTEHTSRRRFLKAAAATGALAGLNATVLAQEGDASSELILLGGDTPGWKGYRLPGGEAALGTRNPTLTLQEGTTYTLIWENVDGASHNFAIQDDQGNNLEVLEPLSVEQETYQQLNETAPDENVSVAVSDGNLTAVNESDGGMAGGNETGGEMTTTQSLVAQTEIINQQGAVQAVRFTATPEMAQYICLVHPNTMLGDVELQSGGGGGSGNNSSA
ncbi:twin-arginine translocation signal domain-containing protein [Halorussus litoreus]|uniref:twin-arginine translocation signal domain-containing protein n=1 Tax=Halorussus litoreus TaxID=1710536 RepID=UPI000E27EF2A|nr:twin-arginine translocation signal domain-containing protein [Halorussus litoreus]